MKSVLFDVDGVFLSEERCFDVSALTVYELLMDNNYLGLDNNNNLNHLDDDIISNVRSNIFVNDKVLHQLKSLGLNSNWDMLYIVFCLHFIKILKLLPLDKIENVLQTKSIKPSQLQLIGQSITKDYQIDYNLPLTFLNSVDSGKENIFASLQEFAKSELSVSNVSLFEFKSSLWYLTQSIYQEWYLGSTLFETVEGQPAYNSDKTGFIHQEIVIRPVEELQNLFNDLKNEGYRIAIATGRPRTETLVPFESLELLPYFDNNHIVTASEVMKAENLYPNYKPLGKPNPFSYIATLNGNKEEYASVQNDIVNKEDVFIVGDSLADLLSAKKIGATFIGTLTGLKGKQAKSELESYEADYIINHVGELRQILL